jgi:hypothetical protein
MPLLPPKLIAGAKVTQMILMLFGSVLFTAAYSNLFTEKFLSDRNS